MKTLCILATFFALLCAPASRSCCADSAAKRVAASDSSSFESPLACDREALTPEQRKKHFEVLGPALRNLRKNVRELPDGYEFEFPSDAASFQMLSEWVYGERICCPFFDINVRMERENGPIYLRLTGRDGVKQFIQVEGSSWLKQ